MLTSFDHSLFTATTIMREPTFSSCRLRIIAGLVIHLLPAGYDEVIIKFRPNQSVHIVRILPYDQTTSPLPLSRFLISLSITCSG